MIDALFFAIDSTLHLFFRFFPEANNPEHIESIAEEQINQIAPHIYNINAVFPLGTLFDILVYVFLLELVLLFWAMIFKAIQLIRG